jgi:hypothetical protein
MIELIPNDLAAAAVAFPADAPSSWSTCYGSATKRSTRFK